MRAYVFWASGLALVAALPGCGDDAGAHGTKAVEAQALAESEVLVGADCVHPSLDCEQLAASLAFPNTVFTASSSVAAGELSVAGQSVGAHCLLVGSMYDRVSPVDGMPYAIGFEMRLPANWNRRFFYQANGGTDGAVATAIGNGSGGGPLTSALLQGFAVISSDAGHGSAQNPTFGIDPQARLDYGYQAVGKLTPMAKSVIRSTYGRAPVRSYIGGCSNGGRHTMVAAARYGEQYDGYLVGSPGFNLPKAAVASIYGGQQYAALAGGATIPAGPFAGLPDLSAGFTLAEQQLLSRKVLDKCDAIDGLQDGMVQASTACQRAFSLERDVPTCAGARDGTCLSATQKVALQAIFAGPTDSLGRPIYSSFRFDAGLAANGTAFWDFISPLILDSGAVGFIFGTPPADPATFIPPLFALTSNIQQLAASITATSGVYTESAQSFMVPPHLNDLDDLRQHGGRMIVYHGVSDPIFSAEDTARWYSGLTAAAQSSARLYLVPGMNHCGDGPATDQFDMLTPLVRWVEEGVPPAQVTASARGPGNPGGANLDLPAEWSPTRTRPLCPFPRVAVYRGGDPERAENFACK